MLNLDSSPLKQETYGGRLVTNYLIVQLNSRLTYVLEKRRNQQKKWDGGYIWIRTAQLKGSLQHFNHRVLITLVKLESLQQTCFSFIIFCVFDTKPFFCRTFPDSENSPYLLFFLAEMVNSWPSVPPS